MKRSSARRARRWLLQEPIRRLHQPREIPHDLILAIEEYKHLPMPLERPR
jgi:hypothetical protein